MPADEHIKRLAYQRVLYTGEPLAHALAALRSTPGQLLPAVTEEQTRLDGAVLAELIRAGGHYWTHPFGVRGVWHEPGKTIIALAHHAVAGEGPPRLMAEFAVGVLLPYAQDETEVGGVCGLRAATVGGKSGLDLHLVEADGPGHVVLRGAKGTTWDPILRQLETTTREYGCKPLWNERGLTAEEGAEQKQYPSYEAGRRAVTWLGGALLQRINLFYAVSTAYSTSSWVTGTRWIIEMETLRRAGHPHDAFLAHLIDPRWGIDLRPVDVRCVCRDVDPELESECTFRLAGPADREGLLELRFRWRHPLDDGHRMAFERVGAAKEWLDRVLPTRARGVQAGAAFHRMLDRVFTGPVR